MSRKSTASFTENLQNFLCDFTRGHVDMSIYVYMCLYVTNTMDSFVHSHDVTCLFQTWDSMVLHAEKHLHVFHV